MCYLTLLSTTAGTDLSAYDGELVKFTTALPGVPEEEYLAHEFKWFLASRSGCSCGFRHLYVGSVALGFGGPEEWLPEDPGDVEATRQAYAVICSLVKAGAEVDSFDAWAHGEPSAEPLAGELEVNIADLPEAAFRFFEGHRFVYVERPSPRNG